MEIKIGAIEGEEVDRRTRIDILTDEEEKIRVEREELELQKQRKDVNIAFISIVLLIFLSFCRITLFGSSFLDIDDSFGVPTKLFSTIIGIFFTVHLIRIFEATHFSCIEKYQVLYPSLCSFIPSTESALLILSK